jgi:hypothetical protein
MSDNEIYIKFEKPYEGLEKINEKEVVLHNYRGNIYLPKGSIIIVKKEFGGTNLDIKELIIENSNESIEYIQATRSITGIYFLLKECVIKDYSQIRIKTELDIGDNPVIYIEYENDCRHKR